MQSDMKKVLTAGDLRQRAGDWFAWDDVRLVIAGKCFPLELGLNPCEDHDWTSVGDFRLLLAEMGDGEPVKFQCQGRSVAVVGVQDDGGPCLLVEEVAPDESDDDGAQVFADAVAG